jgi:crotonobetainyl-CoA:carnitine CoA-transferase CaiB-like acyl-CoA transferase
MPLVHPKYPAKEPPFGMGMPIKFSEARAEFDQPPPELGQHNETVYRDILGYDPARIAQLREKGVI